MYTAPWRSKIERCSDDRELNQARSQPDIVDRRVRTARTFVHHYTSSQYCSTETEIVFFIFPFPVLSDQRHILDVAKWR